MAALSNTSNRQTGEKTIPRTLSEYIVQVMHANLQAANFVTRRDLDVRPAGQTVDFVVDAVRTGFSYADGNRLTDNISATTYTIKSLTVNTLPMSPFVILDSLTLQSQMDVKAMGFKQAAYYVAKTIDTGILAEGLNFSANVIQNETTPTTAVTVAQAAACQATLDKLDYPAEDRVWFFYPTIFQDFKGLSGNYFTSMDFTTTQSLVKGQIASLLLGSPWVQTTNLPTGTSGSPVSTFRKNMYFHKSAIAVAMQREPEKQESYEVDLQGTLCNVRAFYGTTTLDASAGVLWYR